MAFGRRRHARDPTSAGGGRLPADAGSATVLLLAAMLALGCLAGLALTLTTIGAARQRAAAGADLAALAAAGMPPADAASVCSRAARISAANGTLLVDCHVVADAVEVTVQVALPGVRADVTAHARAGPWGQAAGAYQPPTDPTDTTDTTDTGLGQERASTGR
ncbi:Rv3654c family TadE-like protein [Frankia canadensis]|nr:Rv3654c family TadE-like protein [Frankia canadensis]